MAGTVTLTEDQWYERYNPLDAPDGSTCWEFEDVKDRDYHTVWSWIDGEAGGTYVVNGFHVVNKYAYAVTEKPWVGDDDLIEVEIQSPEEERQQWRESFPGEELEEFSETLLGEFSL